LILTLILSSGFINNPSEAFSELLPIPSKPTKKFLKDLRSMRGLLLNAAFYQPVLVSFLPIINTNLHLGQVSIKPTGLAYERQ
jgi:hypothetical protein